ncbi:MAG: hypothetical protein WA775_13180 [Psychroserpens sp.]|uniref:hypothetical protein n=1 Tax=Psychroserpens sp. TaxID=2020870 RepID=UPI003C77835D
MTNETLIIWVLSLPRSLAWSMVALSLPAFFEKNKKELKQAVQLRTNYDFFQNNLDE